MSAPEPVVGAAFITLGWAAAAALPGVWIHGGAAAGTLMPAGGLLYTAGAISYHRRRPTPIRRCSGTTRFSTPASAPPRGASSPR